MPVLQEQKLVIILTGLGILATQKSTAKSLPREALWVEPAPRSALGRACPAKRFGYTAGNTMVVRGGFNRDLSFPGFRHTTLLAI
jgi:hypothetical protein